MSWGKVGVNPFILGITVVLTFIGVRVITNPDLDLGTKLLFILFFLLITFLALLFEAMVKVEGEKTKRFTNEGSSIRLRGVLLKAFATRFSNCFQRPESRKNFISKSSY